MVNEYVAQLEQRMKVREGSRHQKLTYAPGKLVISKLLKSVCACFDTTISIQARTFWGDKMTVVFPEGISTQLFQYGFLDREEGLTKAILEFLKPGMVFFDVGAHIGYYTLLGTHLVGQEGQVHAFEPTPSTFEILQMNTGNRKNIRLNNLAVWSTESTLPFSDFGFRYSGFNSAYSPRLNGQASAKSTPVTHDVQTISLDKYVQETGAAPNFIKIDAESAEYNVLQGMTRILDEFRPIVCVEVGDMDLEDVVASRDMLHSVTDRGYKAFEFQGMRMLEHHIKDRYESGNILFLPVS